MMEYIFWTEDPSILYKNDNYLEIIPTSRMTHIEQLNALTRLSIYYLILLIIFGRSGSWFYLPIIVIILCIIIYYIYKYDPNGKLKEYEMKRKQIEENFTSNADVFYEANPQYELESGYYDFDNNLILGQEYGVHTKPIKELTYTLDEFADFTKATCKKPTVNNPFMNPLVSEFNTDNPPSACNADDDEIKAQIDINFRKNLYMDVDDLFNIKNSQRQFYTIPMPAIPPDQSSFANWLYKTELTCKENQEGCLRYEDLRYKR